jgi:hypothetical protein
MRMISQMLLCIMPSISKRQQSYAGTKPLPLRPLFAGRGLYKRTIYVYGVLI